MAVLPALCVVLGLLASPASGGQSATILWQGRTPEDGTAFAAGLGRELRIDLEASGSFNSSVQIRIERLPRGAKLVPTGDSPAKASFRWTPTAKQLGEWTLAFWAEAGASSAPPLEFRVHVGRRATRTFRLSSAGGKSQNAQLLRPAPAYARPSADSRVVTTLKAITPEHVPHVLYLSSGRIDVQGRYWVRVPLPRLPNGSMGWVRREALGEFLTVDTHLLIDRSRLRATLFRRGRPVFSAVVGVGEARWPTPAGRFYIRERLTGFTDPIYGRLAFGTNGRSSILTDWPGGGFIGIHGTNQPGILPGRVSHGCVRLRNDAIRRLDRLMRIGTPVTIK